MKSMQRKFGGMMKRSADEADVGAVIAEFKQVDEMLSQLIKDLKAYRNSWDDVLKLQYDCSEAFADLYKPVEPANSPEMRHQPAVTPQSYMQKCLGLQKLYSETKDDLLQELSLIDQRLIRPAESAKEATKGLHKTLKHRDNAKLDYEKYQGRVEHAQKKEIRSIKEEAALAGHEQNLAQAQIDYQTADEQVKQTFPPLTSAILSLFPYLLANQVMLQTTLVGQLYTLLDKYTRTHKMPNPAPSDAEIVRAWEQEFSGFRRELEQGVSVIANGKAVGKPMALPVEKGQTYTGLGIRNKAGGLGGKVGGMVGRKGSGASGQTEGNASGQMQRPTIGPRVSSGFSGTTSHYDNGNGIVEEEEAPPSRPPRSGGAMSPMGMGMPSPSIPMGSKPRIPSSSALSPYDQRPSALTPEWPSHPPPSYEQAASGATTPSHYQTPMNGSTTSLASDQKHDYFAAARRVSQSSIASSAAAKKKPPPPKPVKRIGSSQLAQYVTAIYDFEGQNPGDLAFREGDRIQVVKRTDSIDDWWEGEVRGVVGSFPANYVEV